jgi:glycosyltransferase involved in cell wall biosynthesis
MINITPRLSIGLPVFNGEDYLEKALNSLINQTFTDFELIISDNASTDRTREICEAYVAKDPRVRYYRNSVNIGATQNWYRVFELSTGEYFASVAHDDVYDPDYMRKCIKVLDQDPSVVVCHSKTTAIDADGNYIGNFEVEVDTTSDKPHVRLYNIIAIDYLCIQLYGAMRSKTLAATRVFSGYYGCDRNTLIELCLMGKIQEVPEYLFFHRLYDDALGAAMNSGKSVDELLLLDPGMDWQNHSYTRITYFTYFSSVSRIVKSPIEQVKCYWQLGRIIFQKGFKRIAQSLGKNGQ